MVSVISFRISWRRCDEIPRVAFVGVVAVEAGGDARLGIVGPHLVAGDLLLHEAVVGLVVVEGVDHVVAIAPGIGTRSSALKPSLSAIARQVEPVPPPALAVLRRGEQAVDHFVVGVGRVVGDEGGDLFGSRRQAGEVEGGAAQQCDLIGGRGGLDLLGFELGENELVDGIARPRRMLHGRRRLRLDLLERPEIALPLGEGIGGQERRETNENRQGCSSHASPSVLVIG